MRIAITSRIFEPEPSAASFRLGALAAAFAEAGDQVEVLTVKPPKSTASEASNRTYRVKRFPVLRDKTGYVRGYVQYMSFDIPLFFRILFGKKRDLIVTEPPPTTGFFVRLAAVLRRAPYSYYAADIWSDAAESTGAPGIVVSIVRSMERFALTGAKEVLSVNEGVTSRVKEIAPRARVSTVGNGVDTTVFNDEGPRYGGAPYVIYPGTASEWQGAGIFIEALELVLRNYPDARLIFLGQGSDWPALRERAAAISAGSVEFIPTVPPSEAAVWMRGAVATVASIRPDTGYNFAFPTKVFASWASGTPVVFAGEGIVSRFMTERGGEVRLGVGLSYDVSLVAAELAHAFKYPPSVQERADLAVWARENVGLDAVATRAVQLLSGA